MLLYPIGTLQASSSLGLMNNISYPFFEANGGCKSSKQYNNLLTLFENQTVQTRKKALTHLLLSYKYDSIFSREYDQIEQFIDTSSGRLESFYVVDFSKGQKPTGITGTTSWTCSLPNTGLYTTVMNSKSNYGFFWNGKSFKIGSVTTVTTNTSVVFDITSLGYGALSLTLAQNGGILYPIYQVYCTLDNLDNFEVVGFADSKYNLPVDSGFMRSGEISFTSKHGV